MKHAFRLLVSALMVLFTFACGEEITPEPTPEKPNPGPGPGPSAQTWSVAGSVQKGPFTQGTTITIQALDETLNPTGKNYSTKTTDDAGSFGIGSQIESRFVEIMAVGYYFNEIEGKVSASTLTLRSLSDLSEEGKTNVNLLTTLESDRMRELVKGGKTVAEARKQAEEEIFGVFNIPNAVGDAGFDKMDITSGTDADAILLAISASLQAGRSVGELSELISKIAGEVANTGSLTSELLRGQITESCMLVDADAVRANLTRRYQALGKADFVIPPFEDYLDVNGNGVIDKKDSWIILGQDDFVVSDKGGSFELTLQHNVEYEVSVEGGNWLSWQDVSTRAYLQDAKIIFTAEANNETDARYAVIKIKDRATAHVEQATVTQKQKDALTVSSSSFELEKAGGTFDITVAHNADVQVNYDDAPWLSLVQTRAMTTNILSFSATANPEVATRVGHIVLTLGELSETVTVYQKGGRTLVLSASEITVGFAGGTVSVQATANIDYEVFGPNVAWMTLQDGAGTQAAVTDSYTWTVQANTTGEARQAVIVFKDKESDLSQTVTVTQEQNPLIEGSTEYKIGWEGGSFDVELETNFDYTASIEQEGNWLSIVSTRAMHSSVITLMAQENPNIGPRTACLWISAAGQSWGITITQRANAQQVTVHVPTPGTLSQVIDQDELHKIVNLKITGELNEDDLRLLRGGEYSISHGVASIYQCDWLVEELDLSEMTTTTGATGDIFRAIPTLTKIVMPLHVETVSSGAFHVLPSLETIDFGSNSDILTLGSKVETGYGYVSFYGAFEKCPALKTVTLPDNLEDLQAAVFMDCTSLEEVIFPETCNVRSLKPLKGAASSGGADLGTALSYNYKGYFNGCTSLETLVLPKSLRKIEQYALYGGQYRKIVFPAGLTTIDPQALFFNCSRLEEVTLPALITEYASYMFAGCQSLTKINTDATITRYPDHCFDGANPALFKLDKGIEYGAYVFANMDYESVEFPEGFTAIPAGMFSGWKNLKSINLAGVEEIGKNAFDGCESLTNIVFPESVKAVWTTAFVCKNLESVVIQSSRTIFGVWEQRYTSLIAGGGYYEGPGYSKDLPEDAVLLEYYDNGNGSKKYSIQGQTNAVSVLIGSSVLSVTGNLTNNASEITFEAGSRCEEFGIAGGTGIRSISLPSTIKRLTKNALSGAAFRSIELPTSLECIGESAFEGCNELRRITLPETVDTLGDNAFYGCKKMYEFEIPATSSLKSIGIRAWGRCNELESFVINGSETITLDSRAFNGLKEVIIGKGVKRLLSSYNDYYGNDDNAPSPEIFRVEEGSALEELQGPLFSSSPTTVSLPATMKVIGDGVFWHFYGTLNMDYSNLESLGEWAFADWKGIPKDLALPSIRTIDDRCFQESGLKILRLGNSLEHIGDLAFRYAPMEELHFGSQTPPPYENWFGYDYPSVIYVPASAYQNYYNAWNGYSWWSKVQTE